MADTPVYLDCNATTPIEPEVAAVVEHYLTIEFGNAGSRTHEFGQRAKRAVQKARRAVGELAGASPSEVIFTSGATESNNLALFGLESYARETGRKHIVSTTIEHKAVLEPLQVLKSRGFDVDLIKPDRTGRIHASEVLDSIRDDTLLISVMAANNETGTVQPLDEIADGLAQSDVVFHTDAAQLFGKDLDLLQHQRIDLISASAHKVFGPKGIGALIVRKARSVKSRMTPLLYGGGQERGLRPGTLPVALICGFGKAAELALRDHHTRLQRNRDLREKILSALHDERVRFRINGNDQHALPHTLNVLIEDVDAEAAIVALKDLVAVSTGSACTSESYTVSHVLSAMGLTEQEAECSIRLSWSHLTPDLDFSAVARRLAQLQPPPH